MIKIDSSKEWYYDIILIFAERASVSGGWPCRGWTITRWGPSRRRCRSSPSTTVRRRRGSSSASPPGRSSTAWRWWATRWWPAGTTWRGSSATTRRSSCGLSIKTRRTGRPALSEHKLTEQILEMTVLFSVIYRCGDISIEWLPSQSFLGLKEGLLF